MGGFGERVALEVRPHWMRVVPALAGTVAAVALLVTGLVVWRSAPLWFGLVLLGLFTLAVFRLVVRVVQWRVTVLVVTSRRLVVRTGVVHRVGRELALRKIVSITCRQSLFGRFLGVGNLEIEVEGEEGSRPIFEVRRPQVVTAQIHEVLETGVPEPEAPPPGRGPLENDYLDQLFARGAITASELEELKARPAHQP